MEPLEQGDVRLVPQGSGWEIHVRLGPDAPWLPLTVVTDTGHRSAVFDVDDLANLYWLCFRVPGGRSEHNEWQ